VPEVRRLLALDRSAPRSAEKPIASAALPQTNAAPLPPAQPLPASATGVPVPDASSHQQTANNQVSTSTKVPLDTPATHKQRDSREHRDAAKTELRPPASDGREISAVVVERPPGVIVVPVDHSAEWSSDRANAHDLQGPETVDEGQFEGVVVACTTETTPYYEGKICMRVKRGTVIQARFDSSTALYLPNTSYPVNQSILQVGDTVSALVRTQHAYRVRVVRPHMP
jgi:hypothetical protein